MSKTYKDDRYKTPIDHKIEREVKKIREAVIDPVVYRKEASRRVNRK